MIVYNDYVIYINISICNICKGTTLFYIQLNLNRAIIIESFVPTQLSSPEKAQLSVDGVSLFTVKSHMGVFSSLRRF